MAVRIFSEYLKTRSGHMITADWGNIKNRLPEPGALRGLAKLLQENICNGSSYLYQLSLPLQAAVLNTNAPGFSHSEKYWLFSSDSGMKETMPKVDSDALAQAIANPLVDRRGAMVPIIENHGEWYQLKDVFAKPYLPEEYAAEVLSGLSRDRLRNIMLGFGEPKEKEDWKIGPDLRLARIFSAEAFSTDVAAGLFTSAPLQIVARLIGHQYFDSLKAAGIIGNNNLADYNAKEIMTDPELPDEKFAQIIATRQIPVKRAGQYLPKSMAGTLRSTRLAEAIHNIYQTGVNVEDISHYFARLFGPADEPVARDIIGQLPLKEELQIRGAIEGKSF